MSKEGYIKIGEHIRIVPGFPFNSRLFNTEGEGLPLIRIRDLLKSKIETYFNGEYSYDFVISEGDILIGMDGDFHIVKWSNKRKALLNQRIMKVAQKEGALIDINYFYYFLFPFLQKVWDITTATTVKHLSTYDISEALEKFPSVSEQRQIATILSTADAVIEKTQATITKYKAIKQGMLQDLFTRGIDTNTGKLRPSYQDAPELYKESKLGWIPREWNEEIFGEQIELVHGHQFRNYDFTEFGVAVVKIGQVKPENVDLSNCSFVSADRMEEFRNETIRNGDVLMALTGATLGKACLVSGLSNPVLQNYRVGRFEPKIKENDIDKSYLYYTLTAGELLNQIFNKVNSGAQGNIGKADFEKAFFKKPPFTEQKLIAERLNSLNKKLQTEQDFLHKQQQIKAGLMNDLLSGKKKVKIKENQMA
jgi:type I restriction enzyme S subunit